MVYLPTNFDSIHVGQYTSPMDGMRKNFLVSPLSGSRIWQAARQLLQGMASVDVRDARGNTALHWAQMGGIEQDTWKGIPSSPKWWGHWDIQIRVPSRNGRLDLFSKCKKLVGRVRGIVVLNQAVQWDVVWAIFSCLKCIYIKQNRSKAARLHDEACYLDGFKHVLIFLALSTPKTWGWWSNLTVFAGGSTCPVVNSSKELMSLLLAAKADPEASGFTQKIRWSWTGVIKWDPDWGDQPMQIHIVIKIFSLEKEMHCWGWFHINDPLLELPLNEWNLRSGACNL